MLKYTVWTGFLLLGSLLALLSLITKLDFIRPNLGSLAEGFGVKSADKTLNYVILNPRGEINLNLYEAERYEPAIVVQSLVGNLVYYSNQGRYEPRLAKSWMRTSPNVWRFQLNHGQKTENGELITPASFKASIERSLRHVSKTGPFPLLSNLKGFREFLKGAPLAGLQATEDELIFEFDQPVKDGLLQLLSFAPFGFIAKANLNPDGTWRDNKKFYSSGPYVVESAELGTRFVLVRNGAWTNGFAAGAPEKIVFTTVMPNALDLSLPWIVDAFISSSEVSAELEKYSLVPEYINSILLGGKYFADQSTRNVFRSFLEKHRAKLPKQWGPHTRSESFYPNQDQSSQGRIHSEGGKLPKPATPLIIEGKLPDDGSPRYYAWQVLKGTLEETGIPYRFANNETTSKAIQNNNYDIRIRGASIGGGAEAWGLSVLFCSDIGPKLPDPSGKVCDLIAAFENEKLSETKFAEEFSKTVDLDAAIIPISHFGIQLYFSPHINRASISPALSIMRFDKLEIAF
jgi:hypothetical protein